MGVRTVNIARRMKYSTVVRRQRRAARVALYGSLSVVLLLLIVLVTLVLPAFRPQVDQAWAEVDFAQLPEVQLLQAYTRIDTSPITGSELAGARFLAENLETAGISAHIERLGEKGANLWAILEGDNPQALGLHNHIDVSPIRKPEGWDFPPFAGEIVPPHIYGRGVFDMKSVAVAQLHALLELKRSGRRPRRSVIFLATGSEEVGSELGTRWILRQHPELVERFWAVLTEGGVVEPLTQREIKYWGIEFSQKRFANAWVCSSNRQRLEALRRDIAESRESGWDLHLTPEVDRFLADYAGTRTREDYRRLLTDAWRTLHDPSEFRQLPNYLRSLFRNEIVAFPVEEDPREGYRLRLVFHLLPAADLAQVREKLLPGWMTHGLAVTFEAPLGSAAASPVEHPAFRTLQSVLEEAHLSARVGPYFLPWSATDSRFFRAVGIPSYGFSPFLIFATDTYRADTANERMGLPGFVEGVRLYRQALQRLAADNR
jgi:acetylornithine deacetylase/succinyl-diaminopimelate desuccinylase-like protein